MIIKLVWYNEAEKILFSVLVWFWAGRGVHKAVNFMLKKRTIMIFPKFDNMVFINELRKKYDPLADKVLPHITLVFPFESSLSKGEILNILENRLRIMSPFEIKAQGLSVSGRWLFLNLIDGIEALSEIHGILYKHEFSKYMPSWLSKYEYNPHITVGLLSSNDEAKSVCEQENGFQHVFYCLVDKIFVEIIGDDEESIIDVEYSLC